MTLAVVPEAKTDSAVVAIPSDAEFGSADFLPSVALSTIAEQIIRENPQRFGQLSGFEILVGWKRRGGSNKGKLRLGTCSRPRGVLTGFTAAHFLITISADHAREYGINGQQLEAVIAHELMHAGVNEQGDPILLPHDVEAFADEIRLYGLIREDLRQIAPIFAQARLDW